MSSNIYGVGDLVRCTGTLATAAGTNTDPSGAITAKVRAPDDTITIYVYGTDAELVKSATGVYYVDVDVTASGTWHYRFSSAGTGQAAGESQFRVEASVF